MAFFCEMELKDKTDAKANIPAETNSEEANAWFPGADEDAGRPGGYRIATTPWAEVTLRID